MWFDRSLHIDPCVLTNQITRFFKSLTFKFYGTRKYNLRYRHSAVQSRTKMKTQVIILEDFSNIFLPIFILSWSFNTSHNLGGCYFQLKVIHSKIFKVNIFSILFFLYYSAFPTWLAYILSNEIVSFFHILRWFIKRPLIMWNDEIFQDFLIFHHQSY